MKTQTAAVKAHKHHEARSGGDIVLSIVCYTIFTICAFLCIYPFYYIFINSISSNELSSRGVILFYPEGIHLQNYLKAFQISGLGNAAFISLARTVLGTIGTVSASAFLGFMFTQDKMWHRRDLCEDRMVVAHHATPKRWHHPIWYLTDAQPRPHEQLLGLCSAGYRFSLLHHPDEDLRGIRSEGAAGSGRD